MCLESYISKYYDGYDEDNRLIKDKSHSIEFITTINYLDKYISDDDKIIELGAATGRYSFHYAKKGCDVTALELSKKHIDIMNNKLKNEKFNVNVFQGNALELGQCEEEYYDCILCLGPMYHLISEEDRQKCIDESLRVLKPGGIIAIAYISKFAHFVDMIKRNKEDIKDQALQSIIKTGSYTGDIESCFYFSTYDEMERVTKENNIERIKHIGTDGIADIIRASINDLTDEEFGMWMKYHLDTCENESLIGYSKHALYIGRKNKD